MAWHENGFEDIIDNRMEQIQLGDQTIRYDREQTKSAYSAMKSGDAERCGCTYCLNFAAQRATVYPENFRSLLDQLGIDPQKESEVYECGPIDGSLRAYGGWFHFVGEVDKAGERLTDAASGFQYWFAEAKHVPGPMVDFGKNALVVQFFTKLPWVISAQPYQPLQNLDSTHWHDGVNRLIKPTVAYPSKQ